LEQKFNQLQKYYVSGRNRRRFRPMAEGGGPEAAVPRRGQVGGGRRRYPRRRPHAQGAAAADAALVQLAAGQSRPQGAPEAAHPAAARPPPAAAAARPCGDGGQNSHVAFGEIFIQLAFAFFSSFVCTGSEGIYCTFALCLFWTLNDIAGKLFFLEVRDLGSFKYSTCEQSSIPAIFLNLLFIELRVFRLLQGELII
jgi:hypothetical protein